MEWLLSWEVSSVVVGILITVALTVLTLNDFKIAKVCFCIAAAYTAASVFMWESHNTLPEAEQIGVGVIALFLIFLLLLVALRYLKAQEEKLFAEELAKKLAEELKRIEGADPSKSIEEQQVIPKDDGFVQFESREIAIEKKEDEQRITEGNLRIGEIIRVRFTFANRGTKPVFDCQSWGTVVCVDPAKNPGKQLRDVMLRGIKVGYEKFKHSGNDLGAGIENFNFAQSTPLTKDEIDGLRTGSIRIHLILGGAWSNKTGDQFFWTNAEWTNWPQVTLDKSFWKGA